MRRWRRHSVISRWVSVLWQCVVFLSFFFYSLLMPFSAGSQWLQEHFQGCQHTNHHLHYVVRSLHFLTGKLWNKSCVLKSWTFPPLDLVPSDALPPCQPCQPLDVGSDLPWGHLGLCQVQVMRARIKLKACFDLVPQWRVQWGGCPDRGAHRKSVGQLLPTDPQQGIKCFFCAAVWLVPLSLCSNLWTSKSVFDQGTIEHSKPNQIPRYISMWAEASRVSQIKSKQILFVNP